MCSMQNTPLPPTWTVVEAEVPQKDAPSPSSTTDSQHDGKDGTGKGLAMQYVNRVTGKKTDRHPGADYFSAIVEQERNQLGRRLKLEVVAGAVGSELEIAGSSVNPVGEGKLCAHSSDDR